MVQQQELLSLRCLVDDFLARLSDPDVRSVGAEQRTVVERRQDDNNVMVIIILIILIITIIYVDTFMKRRVSG